MCNLFSFDHVRFESKWHNLLSFKVCVIKAFIQLELCVMITNYSVKQGIENTASPVEGILLSCVRNS